MNEKKKKTHFKEAQIFKELTETINQYQILKKKINSCVSEEWQF